MPSAKYQVQSGPIVTHWQWRLRKNTWLQQFQEAAVNASQPFFQPSRALRSDRYRLPTSSGERRFDEHGRMVSFVAVAKCSRVGVLTVGGPLGRMHYGH